jgi:hypothetical protein
MTGIDHVSIEDRGPDIVRATRRFTVGILMFALALLSGCRGQENIRVYNVPKETNEAPMAEAGSPHGGVSLPRLVWKELPPGWIQRPRASEGQMRIASFTIQGGQGHDAEVAVVALPGLGGTDLDFVNLWREQLKLTPVAAGDLGAMLSAVKIGDQSGKLFDVSGPAPGEGEAVGERIVVAILERVGTSWFFKLHGEGPLVAREKAAFLQFLEGIEFVEGAPSSPAPSLAASSPAPMGGSRGKPKWDVPQGWKETAPPQMIMASFALTGEGGASADVTVSSFPGDVGGVLANVNRWRGQLQLEGVNDAGLKDVAGSLEVTGGTAVMVDMTGTRSGKPARLIGVIVPNGGNTWFYKLLGSPLVAEKEKAAFLKFVQSVRYSNG